MGGNHFFFIKKLHYIYYVTLIVVFVVFFSLMLGFVDFCVFCFCIIMLLNYTKPKKKKTPPKSGNFPIFFYNQLWLHILKLLFLFGCFFFFFFFVAQKTIKIKIFNDFEMLIFIFFLNNRVNNLATVKFTIWPHFLQKFWKNTISYNFHVFFFFTHSKQKKF